MASSAPKSSHKRTNHFYHLWTLNVTRREERKTYIGTYNSSSGNQQKVPKPVSSFSLPFPSCTCTNLLELAVHVQLPDQGAALEVRQNWACPAGDTQPQEPVQRLADEQLQFEGICTYNCSFREFERSQARYRAKRSRP